VNGCAGGWRALCGAAGSEEALRVYTPAACSRAPVSLYWLPKQPHLIPAGALPGLAGGITELFVSFFLSVEAGAPDATPLRTSDGARMTDCAAGTPAAQRAAQQGGPCARAAGAPPWPLSLVS
jgi:hypothetical protein